MCPTSIPSRSCTGNTGGERSSLSTMTAQEEEHRGRKRERDFAHLRNADDFNDLASTVGLCPGAQAAQPCGTCSPVVGLRIQRHHEDTGRPPHCAPKKTELHDSWCVHRIKAPGAVAVARQAKPSFTFTAQTSQKHRWELNEAVFVCSRDHQLSAHLSTARADSQKAEAGQASHSRRERRAVRATTSHGLARATLSHSRSRRRDNLTGDRTRRSQGSCVCRVYHAETCLSPTSSQSQFVARGHAHRARRSLIETDDPRSQAGRAGRPPADPTVFAVEI